LSAKNLATSVSESSAFGGVPGSAKPISARIPNPIPVAASNFLPLASATSM
jgi:hypothetical protein